MPDKRTLIKAWLTPSLLGLDLRLLPPVTCCVWQPFEEVAKPDAAGLKLLRDAAETMRLPARGYHRVLRVARTLAEALSYRPLTEGGLQAA